MHRVHVPGFHCKLRWIIRCLRQEARRSETRNPLTRTVHIIFSLITYYHSLSLNSPFPPIFQFEIHFSQLLQLITSNPKIFFTSSKAMEKRRDEQGCETPKREVNRAPPQCPAAPRKKLPVLSKKKRDPPKNGYFQPPSDLEALFVRVPRREACA